MSRAVKYAIATAVALIAIAAPAGAASAASLKVTAPTKISAQKKFNAVASGKGNFKHNFIALFFSHFKCKSTWAAENSALGPPPSGHLSNQLYGKFVGKTFKVTMLKNIKGGSPGSGFLCTYLYPKSNSPTALIKKPEVLNKHKIRFT